MDTNFLIIFIIVIIWSLIWKGFALWKAARNEDKVWYTVMLFLNTLGILEIIYIYIIGKKKENK